MTLWASLMITVPYLICSHKNKTMKKESIYIDKSSIEDFAKLMKEKLNSGAIVIHSDLNYTCNPARHTEFKVFGVITFEIAE